MGAPRFLLMAGLALLCAAWAKASTIPVQPGYFTVNLNDNCSVNPNNPDCSNPTGTGGWGDNTLFIDVVNTVNSTNDFIEGQLCSNNYASLDEDPDPSIRLNAGGDSSPFPSSFNADEAGGGFFDFLNDSGVPYNDILFITNYVPGQMYTCASDIYGFCGFRVVPEAKGPEKLEILFTDGSIPVATPEPSEYLLVLIAGTMLVMGRRLRSPRAGSS